MAERRGNTCWRLKILKKSFGQTDVLHDISLSVNKGDVIAILGPSGSGKTTLLRCLNFLEKADGGTMTFDDETIELHKASKRTIARIRKKTAFVFQNYNLFANKTALQNVTEGLIVGRKMPKDEANKIAHEALKRLAWKIEVITIRRSFQVVSSSVWRLRGQ